MSETNAPEPTMEEILASIRRIISEDDAPASTAADAVASPGDPPEPPPVPAAHAPEPSAHDDVLELTDRVEAEPPPAPAPAMAAPAPVSPAPVSLGDLDFAPSSAAPPAAPPQRPAPSAPPMAKRPADEPLVGSGAAGRAADHFGALASSLAMPSQGRTLEDVVRELLGPMLKEWLDQHLPAIVEARVQDEVERISRRRTY